MRLLERQRAEMRSALTTRTMIRPAKTSVVTQALVDGATRWTFPQVLSAIDAHEAGDFSQSGLLISAMGRDDRISACMRTRVNAIVGTNGLDFSIDPPDGEGPELAARVGEWWFDALPDASLRQVAWDMILGGFHLSRVHYARSASEWRPERLERWHPANVRYDRQLERYIARFDGGEVVVEPGDPEWLLVTPAGDESWMSGAVRALGVAYVMRGFNWRDWARFNEKHGMPLLVIKEPANVDPALRRSFFAGVQKMGSTGIVRLPVNTQGEGFGVEYVEAKDRSHATFQTFRTDLDAAIAITLLGQNLSTEVHGGSYAAARAQDRIRMDYLAADCEVLSTSLRDQLVKPWGRFNVPGWGDSRAPWPTWDTDQPVDRQVEATTLKTVADAVVVLQSTGMPVDYRELFARVGVPVLEGQDPNDVEPPAKPAPVQQPVPPGSRARALASGRGMLAPRHPGFVAGQAYADDLVEEGKERAAKGDSRGAASGSHAAFLDEILRIIDEGADYETIRQAVLRFYDGAAEPEHVRDTLEKIMTLADLAGRHAVLEDVGSDDEDDEGLT